MLQLKVKVTLPHHKLHEVKYLRLCPAHGKKAVKIANHAAFLHGCDMMTRKAI